jgi:hypothetical protein
MKSKLKVFGLALAAALAVAAMSAATSGAEWHVHETGKIQALNVGEEVFTMNAGTVKCEVSEFNGSVGSTTPGAIIGRTTYKNCTAFGFVNTPIDVGSCEYEFTTPVATTSTGHIVNCGVTPMRITAFNCEITIGNQGPLSHVTWTQVAGPPAHLQGHTTTTGTKYTQHSKSFPGCTNGTFTNGTYTGTFTAKAFNGVGKQVGITVT